MDSKIIQNSRTLVDSIWRNNESFSIGASLEELLSAEGFSLDDPHDLESFESVYKKVRSGLIERIAAAEEQGLVPKFRSSEANPDWLSYQSRSVSQESREAAEAVISGLPWRAFEKLCVRVLELGGVSKCKAMRGLKEGGVDLFGVLDPSQSLHPALWKGALLRVFCQAKKGRVGEPVVRQFKNDLDDLSKEKGRAFQLLPKDIRFLKTSILGGVFTATGFTLDAENYAKHSGFFLVDPSRIAEIVLTSKRELPGLVSSIGTLVPEPTLLCEYLNSM